jgi:Protein of unknown function (DUF2905)
MVGRLLIVAGCGLVLLGLLFPLLGHLPGDLRFGRGAVRVYLPLGSSVLVSVLLSLVLSVVMWLGRR